MAWGTMGLGDRDLTGRRLGPYELEELLGEGAFGRVYRARHVDLDVLRAVKVMRPDIAGDRRFRERFLREARTAARLDHPNIVAVHDFAAEAEVQYLVMEYVDSLTLAERLEDGPVAGRLADPTVHRWIRDVADALDHAHEEGVVHRDLKPANVLVRRRDERAMLTDFGIAQAVNEPSLTLTGRALGTYAYMSPEQIRGASNLTSAVDVYAFAAMVIEIATGEPPFGRGIAAVGGHLNGAAPALRFGEGELAGRLGEVLAVGLAKEPGDRYRTAGELAAAVLEVVGGSTGSEVTVGDPAASVPALTEPERVREPDPTMAPGHPEEPDRTVTAAWTVRPPGDVPVTPPAAEAAAAPPRVSPPVRLPAIPRRLALGLAGGAVLAIAAVAAGVAVLAPRPTPPAPPQPARVRLPAPVRGTIGDQFVLAGTALTVLAASTEAPPAGLRVGANQRLVVVLVRCRAAGPGPSFASPYDWSIVDGAGNVFVPVVEGIQDPLAERELTRGQTTQGRVAFVVPRAARGLSLNVTGEPGDPVAQIVIPPGV